MKKLLKWISERKLLSIGIGLVLAAGIVAPFTEYETRPVDSKTAEEVQEQTSVIRVIKP